MYPEIPSLPEIKFLKPDNIEPVLKQISKQNEELLQMIKPYNHLIAKNIITEYGISKNKFLDDLFKKYDSNYFGLRTELQKFIEERKNAIENLIKHLK